MGQCWKGMSASELPGGSASPVIPYQFNLFLHLKPVCYTSLCRWMEGLITTQEEREEPVRVLAERTEHWNIGALLAGYSFNSISRWNRSNALAKATTDPYTKAGREFERASPFCLQPSDLPAEFQLCWLTQLLPLNQFGSLLAFSGRFSWWVLSLIFLNRIFRDH